jgi:DNA-3-methyladenine glycosylase
MVLPQKFYARETIDVAEQLLGKRLVRKLPGGDRLAGRIVEVEAYLGLDDAAAHTFQGRRTSRNESMYGEAGFSYVYFIYGIHHCLNIVTALREVPEAVLIRALEPVEGFNFLKTRTRQPLPTKWLNGPGKLCFALNVTREHNGIPLFKPDAPLSIEDDISYSQAEILRSPRVGIDYAGDAAEWPLRFGVRGNSYLSPPKFEPDH